MQQAEPRLEPVAQDLTGKGMHRRLGVAGAELCDDHHTLPAFLFIVPTPMFGPLLRALLPRHLHVP